MTKTITATFRTRADAESAIAELETSGFSRNDVSVLMNEQTRSKFFGIEDASKAPEGIATGGVVGGIIGAIAAGLVAIGSVAVPGAGFLAAGPLVAAFTGGGAGALTGGLVGGLIGLGLPEHEAKLYESDVKGGAILIAVTTHNDAENDLAEAILKRSNAQNLAAA
ncbi:hypothetical protein GC177_03335 [bacterium]|nr:hypothetical protein [bacterium]